MEVLTAIHLLVIIFVVNMRNWQSEKVLKIEILGAAFHTIISENKMIENVLFFTLHLQKED